MSQFIFLVDGIKKIYLKVNDELQESDFFELTIEQQQKINMAGNNEPHFIVNPAKLKQEFCDDAAYIVSNTEKHILFKAQNYIFNLTRELPDHASFRERLLLAKSSIPPIF